MLQLCLFQVMMMQKSKTRPISIYVHFPYCVRKCRYCDFISFPCGFGAKFPDDICDYYVREICAWCRGLPVAGRNVTSIYFGGGTPSLMSPEWVERIVNVVCENFSVSDDVEVSLEVNPATVNETKVADFRLAGVNRISLGVQSLDDERLRFFGRIHNVAQAMETLEYVRKYFDNVSCDFIYATPNQTLEKWADELEKIIALGVPHLSLYQLIVERGTPLARQVKLGDVVPVSECMAGQMFRLTNSRMAKVCPQYEVSNYAVCRDMQSRHNVNYWVGGDYLGIGVGAAGRVYDDVKQKLWQSVNPNTVDKWCRMIDEERLSVKPISKRVRAEELLIMGLRQVCGISFSEFFANCGVEFERVVNMDRVRALAMAKMIVLKKNGVRVSRKGLNVLDAILREIVV